MRVTELIKNEQCTGCSACCCSCPKDAIYMVSRSEDGFKYPMVDNNKCIDCNICVNTCPILQTNKQSDQSIIYAGWSKDDNNRLNSTSGGAFFEIAKQFIADGGCVVGAKYTDENLVVHDVARTVKDLKLLRQSKYVQSDIGDIFKKIKAQLVIGEKVLFCGTPCQTAGLKAYLKKEYDNLLTIDFICRGVNSPKAYFAWLKEIEKKEKSKIIKVWFKNKTYGWKNSPWCTKIEFANGKEKLFYQNDNLYMRGYLIDNLYMRKSCGNCAFKDPQRFADITLGDFWGAGKSIDDDNGTSVIFVNSGKGAEALNKIRENMHLEIINSELVESGNVCLQNSAVLNFKSILFLNDLDKYSFSIAYFKYRILNRFSIILKKINIVT